MSQDEPSELDFSIAEIDVLTKDEGDPALRFTLAGRHLAIVAEVVAEIVERPVSIPLPGVRPFVDGVFISSGRAIALVDLVTWFGLKTQSTFRYVVVVTIGDWRVGFLVDDVKGIEPFPDDNEGDAIIHINSRVARYARRARWAPGGVVALIDIERLVRDMANQVQLEEL